MVASCLIGGFVGVLVTSASMPVGMLVSLRMAMAAAALGVMLLLRRRREKIVDPLVYRQLFSLGVVAAGGLALVFVSIRYAGVATAVFLTCLWPVYVAAAAPLVLKVNTERVVWFCLAIAIGGITAIVLPGALSGDARFSPLGIAAGIGGGLTAAVAMMLTKSLRRSISSATIVFSECLLAFALLLPLGIWQVITTGYSFNVGDMLIVVALGLFTTAMSFVLQAHGMRFIPVQHVGVISFLEPVAGTLYAALLLAQRPSGWTLLGGLLLVTAGVLVVLFGKTEAELSDGYHGV